MAKKELSGLTKCPECDFNDAEVRPDKGGSLYRYCPECSSQYFTRGDALKTANLLKKTRKIDQEKALAAAIEAGAVAKDKLTPPAKAAPVAKAAPAPAPNPATKPSAPASSWSPLIG